MSNVGTMSLDIKQVEYVCIVAKSVSMIVEFETIKRGKSYQNSRKCCLRKLGYSGQPYDTYPIIHGQ